MRKQTPVTNLLVIMVLGSLLTSLAAEPPIGDKTKDVGFPDLVAALKATPGCLGVETARTSSGKQVIFAWFENRRAVLKWYYSDAHQDAMKSFFPGFESRKPLKEVPEDSGPIMVIASITMAKQAQFK